MRLAVGATCDLKEEAAALGEPAAEGWKDPIERGPWRGGRGRLLWITCGVQCVVSFGSL